MGVLCKTIAAIVVTYNRKKLLEECLLALIAQNNENLDILVIDNASTDGTYETIRSMLSEHTTIKYYNTGSNLGGAGGFQFGVKLGLSLGYDYLWLMDDDTIPSKTALKELLIAEAKLKGNYGFLSSKVLWTDGSLCHMNIQRTSLRKNVTDFGSVYTSVSMASFVSLFIKRTVIIDVGLPIKEFFIWCDDAEYTRRISKKYPSYLVNKSIVVHKTNQNAGSDISKIDHNRLDRSWYLYRNSYYFYRREGIIGISLKFMQIVFHIMKVLFFAPDYKIRRIKAIINGTKAGIHFRPGIEYYTEN